MKNTINKLITIPVETAKGLLLIAAQNGTQTKPYMEQVLIEHEKKVNNKKSANYKLLNPVKPKK